MVHAAQATDIDFAEFVIEVSEVQRTLNTFLDNYCQGQDVKPTFDLLLWQLNTLTDLYS